MCTTVCVHSMCNLCALQRAASCHCTSSPQRTLPCGIWVWALSVSCCHPPSLFFRLAARRLPRHGDPAAQTPSAKLPTGTSDWASTTSPWQPPSTRAPHFCCSCLPDTSPVNPLPGVPSLPGVPGFLAWSTSSSSASSPAGSAETSQCSPRLADPCCAASLHQWLQFSSSLWTCSLAARLSSQKLDPEPGTLTRPTAVLFSLRVVTFLLLHKLIWVNFPRTDDQLPGPQSLTSREWE